VDLPPRGVRGGRQACSGDPIFFWSGCGAWPRCVAATGRHAKNRQRCPH
jgi:hypothetical protein